MSFDKKDHQKRGKGMFARLLAAFFIVSSFVLASFFSWKLCFWCLLTRFFLWVYLFTTSDKLGFFVLCSAFVASSIAYYQSLYPELALCPIGAAAPWAQCALEEQPHMWGHSISLTTLAWLAIILLIVLHLKESSQQKHTPHP